MASPSISSQPRSPTLSYADHAKKAQNIKSPISHRSLVLSVPPPAATTAVSSPTPLSLRPPSSPADISHPPNNPPTTQAASPPPTPQTTDTLDILTPDSTRRPSANLAARALSIVAAHNAARKTPVVNVWNLRMEQMAAARAAPERSQVPASQSKIFPPKSANLPDRPPLITSSSKTLAGSAPNAARGPSAVNGVTPLEVPPTTDTDSWPEVGKSLTPTTTTTESKEESGIVIANGLVGDSTPATTSTSRKSEKTKWVPIPSEELQAAADALAKASHSRQHSRSRKSHPRPGNTNNNAAQGSSSGSGSGQGHSRIQSASHSRVHSRSESLQSSPHLPRARRLPVDDAGTGVDGYGGQGTLERNRNNVPRSGASSPPLLQTQPHQNPPPQTILPEDQPPSSYTNINVHDTNRSSGMAYPIPVYSQQAQTNGGLPLHYTQNHPQQSVSLHGQDPKYAMHASRANYTSPGGTPPLPPPNPYVFHHPPDTSVTGGVSFGFTCYHCGKPGHTQRSCPERSDTSNTVDVSHSTGCYRCGKTGHTPRACPEPAAGYGGLNGNPTFPTFPVYPPYDYTSPVMSPQPYGYWSGHHSQPGSGNHSPAYPPAYGMAFNQAYTAHQQRQYQLLLQQQNRTPWDRTRNKSLSASTKTANEDDAFVVRMHLRPPPPAESLPVAGYRLAAAPVPSPPADTDIHVAGAERITNGVVFGSIGQPGASVFPSPTLPCTANGTEGAEDLGEEKPFTQFTIGLGPGELAPPARSRSRTLSSTQSHSGKRSRMTTVEDGLGEVREHVVVAHSAEVRVIDLTDLVGDLKDAKWEFGTTSETSELGDEADPQSRLESAAAAAPVTEAIGGEEEEEVSKANDPKGLQPILPSIVGFESPLRTGYASTGSSPSQLQMRLQQLSVSRLPSRLLADEDATEEAFKVKDYGYGFGSGSRGSVSPPDVPQEQPQGEEASTLPAQEWDMDHRHTDKRVAEVPTRPKRGNGSYAGYAPTERGGHERGESRGYGRRGRGMNGFGRGFNRRGGSGYQPTQQQRQPPPFTVTPPTGHYQPMVNAFGDMMNGFYGPRQNVNMATYIPRGYETYVPPIAVAPTPASHPIPPVPVPISPISFPLDPTRYYLLGQLEYYLSPQNMAQDFFLRQRMDSRGWIPVSLIASFNRVRQVTIDAQLVRDVLLLSSVVEVKGEWVRMVSWEQFVLPDAMPSKIERVDLEFEEPHDAPNHKEHIRQGPVPEDEGNREEGDADADAEMDDDEEEEDVVFVMGREEGVSWSPEKRT